MWVVRRTCSLALCVEGVTVALVLVVRTWVMRSGEVCSVVSSELVTVQSDINF